MSHIRLLNLQKRLRERLKTIGADQGTLALIGEIETMTAELICVATRVKELRKEVSDAEWEGSKDLQKLTHELKYYENLASKGEKYDPNF